MKGQNIFECPIVPKNHELETVLVSHPRAKIKKIISPPNFKSEIFCQDLDEWVYLIEGEATLQIDGIIHSLQKGDWLHIHANTEHQITNTSTKPLAIWLALYF